MRQLHFILVLEGAVNKKYSAFVPWFVCSFVPWSRFRSKVLRFTEKQGGHGGCAIEAKEKAGLAALPLCVRLLAKGCYFLNRLRTATRPINPLPSSQAAAGMGTVEMGRQDQEVPFVMVISAAPTFTPLAHT